MRCSLSFCNHHFVHMTENEILRGSWPHDTHKSGIRPPRDVADDPVTIVIMKLSGC
jgi:hypothetical protein